MTELAVLRPGDSLHEQALDHTHPLWHDGLTRHDYRRYNEAQLRTRWGARHLARVGLVERGRLLASAKRYALRIRLHGRCLPALGIGAVFTPPELRGRGHARHLVESLVGGARDEGAALAMLFSEIGPAYYERLGFTTVPALEAAIAVRVRRGAPAVLLRSAEDRDLPLLAEMHDHRAAAYRLALCYDADWLQYSVAKKRLLAALSGLGGREVEFFVVEEGTRAVAWLLLQVARARRSGGADRWSVAACGDRDPSGARVGAMLQALLARAPADRLPAIRAWWPARLAPPQLDIQRRASTALTMMVRPLRAVGAIDGSLTFDDILYWYGDAF